MESRLCRVLQCPPYSIDITLLGSGKTGHRAVLDRFADPFHCVEVTLGGSREAGLYDVDSQAFQLLCHFDLFKRIEVHTRRLFTVAKRGIENINGSHWRPLPSLFWRISAVRMASWPSIPCRPLRSDARFHAC